VFAGPGSPQIPGALLPTIRFRHQRTNTITDWKLFSLSCAIS